jgi:hypothetical protein
MKIDCYLLVGCGAEQALRENLTNALAAEQVHAKITFHIVEVEKAVALKLSGSPSVFVNGKEIQPQGTVGFS